MIFSQARRAAGAATILVGALAFTSLVSCSSEPEWHPVTTEESQVLALARFNNFDQGIRSFETDIVVQGQGLRITGWVDYVEHAGYAGVSGEGFQDQVLLWNSDSIGITPASLLPSGFPPQQLSVLQQKDSAVRPLSPEDSNLDTLLFFLLSLGNDRPENPLLLQQAGALWLGTETVERDEQEVELNVFATPPSEEALAAGDPQPTPEDAVVKMKLDERAVLDSVEAFIAGEWVTLEFFTAEAREFLPDITELTPES